MSTRQKKNIILSNFVTQTNIFFILMLIVLIYTSFYNFLLFHNFVEILSVIVSSIIFVIAIYTYDRVENNFLIIMGISYGFIGFFDLLHTLSYKGMHVFINTGANLPTQLWIITRYLESSAILIALIYLGSKIKCNKNKIIYSLLILSGVFISLLYFDIFPTAYIEGEGLTSFKIFSEYIISTILIFSLYLLYNKKGIFDSNIYWFIFISITMTIISEISFTFYVDVYGLSNIIGHIFKVLSVMLIFKAIVETGFKKPYELLFKELKIKKDQLAEDKQFISSIYNNIEQGICVHELLYNEDNEAIDYKIIDANNAYESILNISAEKAIGKLGSNIYSTEDAPYLNIYAESVQTRKTRKLEVHYSPMEKHFNITVTPFKENQFITLFEDITELKEKEFELKSRYQEVQKLNNELEKLIYLTNRLSITSKLKIDEFLKDVLEIAIKLIDHADYGSISIFKKESWQVIDSYNYKEEFINELNIKRDLIYKDDESLFKVDLIKMNNKELLKEFAEDENYNKIYKYLKRAKEKIKESIFFELDFNSDKKIRVSLDISNDFDNNFNQNDEKILGALKNLVQVFLNLNKKSKNDQRVEDNNIFKE